MTEVSEISGRPVFAIVAIAVVALAGLLGAVVGASGQERGVAMDLAGVVSFGMTPVSMAAFGVLATGSVLAVLFGLVSIASKYDEGSAR
ncbi:hypothetical protein NGM10_04265 [Halorussus salilacus]|uniref:DUF7520 family protein n=1 Tax=Halorussus salilacus TaxID=2953750 RepID=UPI00209E7CCE|nr:hypothetical protein [Halorussus salilacus]USZ68956.1 hypothetical protein NGM10_04265 [Halorussus salilacus]